MGPSELENNTPSVEPEQQSTPAAEQFSSVQQEPVVETVESGDGPTESAVSPEVVAPTEPVAAPVASPAETTALEGGASQDAPVPELPVKKSKKGLIIGLIVSGIVLLSLTVAGIVYATVYNNPENAVIDAFSKAFAAKSGTVEGSAGFKMQDFSLKLDIKSAANEAKQSSASVKTVLNTRGKDYTLTSSLVGTNEEVYVKIDDLRAVIRGVLGAEYMDMVDDHYGSLIGKIDGKWVVIRQSDLSELTEGSVSDKETQCVQDEFAKLRADASARDEMTSVYRKNPLFIVESKGSDNNGNRYKLTPVSNDKARDFFKAVVETKFFKAIDDCTSTDMRKELIDGLSTGTPSDNAKNATFEVWVDGWSHELKKVSLNIKDEQGELTSEFNTRFNNNPSVTIPKADTTINDLRNEIKDIQRQLSPSYRDSDAAQDYYVY